MLENRTRLLLILSQDLLDQARVIAGRATTSLKLPVSLQIVLRALIWVALRRESHSALFADIERQARALRQTRNRVPCAGAGRQLPSRSQGGKRAPTRCVSETRRGCADGEMYRSG